MSTTLVGSWYINTYNKITKIIRYQNEQNIRKGIRGFLFYGIPGTGKTALATEIGNYCARQFGGRTNPEEYKKYFQILDCSQLAHARYGETEAHIHQVFGTAEKAKQMGIKYQVLIFDDADGLFITRDYGQKLEAWYIGQINVFFHELDNMDTSDVCVILTTNRIDLMDKAVLDRLYLIEFPQVPLETLLKKVEDMGRDLQLTPEHISFLKEDIEKNTDYIKSFRDIEKKVYDYFLTVVLGEDW